MCERGVSERLVSLPSLGPLSNRVIPKSAPRERKTSQRTITQQRAREASNAVRPDLLVISEIQMRQRRVFLQEIGHLHRKQRRERHIAERQCRDVRVGRDFREHISQCRCAELLVLSDQAISADRGSAHLCVSFQQ